jgi:hypothetical protein
MGGERSDERIPPGDDGVDLVLVGHERMVAAGGGGGTTEVFTTTASAEELRAWARSELDRAVAAAGPGCIVDDHGAGWKVVSDRAGWRTVDSVVLVPWDATSGGIPPMRLVRADRIRPGTTHLIERHAGGIPIPEVRSEETVRRSEPRRWSWRRAR